MGEVLARPIFSGPFTQTSEGSPGQMGSTIRRSPNPGNLFSSGGGTNIATPTSNENKTSHSELIARGITNLWQGSIIANMAKGNRLTPPYVITDNDIAFGHLQFNGSGDPGDHLAAFSNIFKIK